MDNILSQNTWQDFSSNGFARSGITLMPATQAKLLQLMDSSNIEGSPWSSFLLSSDRLVGSNYGVEEWMTKDEGAIEMIHESFNRQNLYSRSLYGMSKVLTGVLDECLSNGLADAFSVDQLLVCHDMFLEGGADKKGFGFHEDGQGLELFYNTDDDVTLFIPLQELNALTGGRLMVDPGFRQSVRYQKRNKVIKELSEACETLGCVDEDGYATREMVVENTAALEMFQQLKDERDSLPQPQPDELMPIDMQAGEVIIFSNKNFHNIEPWAAHNSDLRRVYIVRLVPIYDVKLKPPAHFLDDQPCNRFVLNLKQQIVEPIDPTTNNPLQHYHIPLP